MDDKADKGAPPPDADSHDDHDQLVGEDMEEKSQMPVVTGCGSSSSGGGHGGSSTTTTLTDSHDDHYQLMEEEEKSQMPVVTGSGGGGSSTTFTPTILNKKKRAARFEVGESTSIGDIQAKVAKKSGNDEEDENANKEYAEDGGVNKSIASWLKDVPDDEEEQDLAEHQDLKVPQDDLSDVPVLATQEL